MFVPENIWRNTFPSEPWDRPNCWRSFAERAAMVSGTSSANTTESIVPGICSLLDSASLLKALGCGICVLDSFKNGSRLLFGAIT